MPRRSDSQEVSAMPQEAVQGYCMESVAAFQKELLAEMPTFPVVPIKPEFHYEKLSALGLPMCIADSAINLKYKFGFPILDIETSD